MNPRTIVFGLLSTFALCACNGGAKDPVLTLEGTFTGTTSDKCQIAVRTSDGALVDSHTIESSFRQEFVITQGKGHYLAQIQCPDGKMANINGFDFEPPRMSINLGEVPLI